MDEELQKALASMVNKTVGAVQTGADFLMRELPEVIQQLLMWHAVRSAVAFSAFLIGALLSIYGARRLWQWATEEDNEMQPFVLLPVVISAFLMLGCFNSLAWLQIMIAPKVYLIEYAASLAK